MTDKEKADCFLELYKEQQGKFKQTREIEFKVNLAIWTFIALGGFYILKEIIPNLCYHQFICFNVLYIGLSILIVYSHYEFWLLPITLSQAKDGFFIRSYICKVEGLMNTPISELPKSKKPKKYKDLEASHKNWMNAEAGITAVLLLLIFIFGILSH